MNEYSVAVFKSRCIHEEILSMFNLKAKFIRCVADEHHAFCKLVCFAFNKTSQARLSHGDQDTEKCLLSVVNMLWLTW